MNLAFYLDHHVPAAIANGLRQLQVDVLTVAEDGRSVGQFGLRGILKSAPFSASLPMKLAESTKLPEVDTA